MNVAKVLKPKLCCLWVNILTVYPINFFNYLIYYVSQKIALIVIMDEKKCINLIILELKTIKVTTADTSVKNCCKNGPYTN